MQAIRHAIRVHRMTPGDAVVALIAVLAEEADKDELPAAEVVDLVQFGLAEYAVIEVLTANRRN